MLSYKFYLRNNDTATGWVEIEEPIGWDGLEIVYTRSAANEGLEGVYSAELEFYNNAKNILTEAYNSTLFDSNVDLKVEFYCDSVLSETIEGYLNFLTYKAEGNTVALQFEESSFSRKFKNRLDTVINLDNPKSIDGNDLTSISRKQIRLHSKEILLKNESEYSEQYDPNTFEYNSNFTGIGPPYAFGTSETHTIPSGLSDCDTRSSTFFFQLGTDKEIISDTTLLESYAIPTAITQGQNPLGKLKVGGVVTVEFDITAAMYIFGKTGIVGGANSKICNCGDVYAEDDYQIDQWDFYFEVIVGAGSNAINLSSGSRDTCGDAYFADLQGKNELYMATVGYTGMLQTIISRPFTAGEQLLWDRKVRYRNISGALSFNANAGDEIYIRIVGITQADYERRLQQSKVAHICEGYVTEGSSIKISSSTKANPSTTEGYLVYECFNRITESITGEIDSFRSDYFGRTDSLPHSYASDGCEAWNLHTKGKILRNLSGQTISMSFSDLFNDWNVKRCLGYRIERVGGKNYVRVEPIEYFFNKDTVVEFSDVESIRTEPAIQRLYNGLEIGYSQWEVESINGIDEFNTKRTYALATTNIKNNASAITNFVSGGYAIEMTRRLQYNINPTTDWKYDDSIFCISLNRIPVTTDVYTGVVANYDVGEVSERNELFTFVGNVFSPATSYNLRFSPANCAAYWYKKIAVALFSKDEKALKFQAGTGNTEMEKSTIDSCNIITTLKESDNIEVVGAGGLFTNAVLFKPSFLFFKYPIDFSTFTVLRDNSIYSLSVTCGGELKKGFVEEIRYKVNKQIAEFKLVELFCEPGEFNNDFNNDFNIGSC